MKMITRHNYEEYFILYMDNELGEDERRMVEAFAQQHPDLKEELDFLLQHKLAPDTSITFAAKEDLLKENGDNLITPGNAEEWLLLYADNELTAVQKDKAEKYLAANPSAQKELALLQQTRLPAETISFPEKKNLYRSEKSRRIIPAWLRVAAVLLITAGLAVLFLVKNKEKDNEELVNASKEEKNKPAVITNEEQKTEGIKVAVNNNNQRATEQKQSNLPGNKQERTVPVYKNSLTAVVNEKNVRKEDIQKENNNIHPKDEKQETAAVNNNKPDNNLPKPDNNNPSIIKDEKNNNAIVKEETPKNINSPNNPLTKETVTPDNPQPSDYTVAGSDDKKNKSRGLFRKIARTFEKRTNIDPTNDDGRLLVAGFAFRTK